LTLHRFERGRLRQLEREDAIAQARQRARQWTPVACPSVPTGVRWQEFIERLRGSVPEAVWDMWLADLHSHGLDGDVLVVGTTPAKAEWTASRLARALEGAARRPVRVVACEQLELREAA